MLKKVLLYPHPGKFTWLSVLIPAIVIFVLIGLLAPFGLSSMTWKDRLSNGVIFGGSTALSIIMIYFGMRHFFGSFMEESTWTLGKEFLLDFIIVLCIIFVNLLLLSLLGEAKDWGSSEFLRFGLKSLIMAIFPVSILLLFEQTQYRTQLNKRLQIEQNKLLQRFSEKEKSLELCDESGAVQLRLHLEELLLLKSDGNYLEVYYLDSEKGLVHKLLRNRLKYFEQEWQELPFLRIHNRYLINTAHLREWQGNAKNFSIRLKAIDKWLPVSRTKVAELKSFFDI